MTVITIFGPKNRHQLQLVFGMYLIPAAYNYSLKFGPNGKLQAPKSLIKGIILKTLLIELCTTSE